MRCGSCGLDNEEAAKFCIQCGSPLQNRCPQCGVENLPHAKFCQECGTALSAPPPAPRRPARPGKAAAGRAARTSRKPRAPASAVQTPTPPPVSYTPKHLADRILAEQAALEARGTTEGERKTITALFADISDSTALIEELDPEEARQIIDPALQLMMEAVHRYEGYVAQSLGDGIFALFGAPLAHEDHPQRALYAALRMQEEGKRYAERVRREQGLNVQIRVGLNTGEVVVRSIRKDDLHTDYVPVGHSTSLAARMESLATPGAILVSEYTYRLTEGYFAFKPLGAAQIKGVSQPIQIYEVLGVGPLRTKLQVAAQRGFVRFVGRQSEMAHLKRALEQVQAGHGQIVGVVGEPGVGKSRLFYEFVGAQRAAPLRSQDCLILETFSVSHSKAYPYLPLIELLRNYFQITLQDDERRRREKITGKVLTLDRSLEEMLPYLLALLGVSDPHATLPQMDAQIRRKRTLDAMKRLLLRESLNQPLIVIFEDLHWLDAETQAFLTLLSESVASARLLLLVNYRPEYQHAWGNKTYYTQVRLDPLGQAEAQELLTTLLGDAQELQPLKLFILAKTEGNPFFMEEMVQALVEEQVLSGEHGRYRLQRSVTALQIPPTVQGILAARIDRLPFEEKTLLQILAVIGKEFALSLLRHVVAQPEETLQRQLFHLQAAEFIYEQPAFPEPEYTFKHALTQEVAYNSLLIERRKALHERTAQAIEEVYRSQLEDHYSELAHHYSRSGNTRKATEYLQHAGQQATQRSAYTDAIIHLTAALELLATLPDTPERTQRELTLQIALGGPLMATKGFAAPEVGQVYARARELCQQVGETPQLFPVLLGLRLSYVVRGEMQAACELGEQCLRLAQRMQDSALLLGAHHALGDTVYLTGDLVSARAHQEQAIALYDPQQHKSLAESQGYDLGMDALAHGAWILWYLGYPEQALQRSRASLTLAQELSHPYSLAHALWCAAWLHQLRQEAAVVQERAEAAIRLSLEYGFVQELAWGTIFRGWAMAKQGQEEEGMNQIRQGLAASQATGAQVLIPDYLTLLADVYGDVGQSEDGLAVLAEAVALMDKIGGHLCEAELCRLKGELLLNAEGGMRNAESNTQHPTPDTLVEAEGCFWQAIEITRKQQAKSLELRATMSLARLWQQQGKKAEARQMLAEIYDWFTEGFDTKDLQEAKGLLEELSQ